jgi:hypothetical protein
VLDLHSTTQVVSRLHATVLGKSCVVEIWLSQYLPVKVGHPVVSSFLNHPLSAILSDLEQHWKYKVKI